MKLKELLLLTPEQKKKGFFLRGNNQCGEYKEYWGQGHLWSQGSYLNGLEHGEYKFYWENGQLRIHCFYGNDILNGEYKSYGDDGKLIGHKLYENGNVIKDYLK